ncbi:tryptophan halogenase family protein [Salinimonas lutimaris]|uniref:tryptophan halogenase family protein n=1 Tax=Salinimonas lutimaris TaxID=914153 RepID=UPI0010C10D48|nr:tryptophan halogenase family protein [Salinimonas lutimaris]
MAQHNSPQIQHIVILGAGAAGWLTAAVIAATHDLPRHPYLTVSVIESPDAPILGVGEGTWPTMRDTLRKIGISEQDIIRQCHGAFKQGTCFRQWGSRQPSGLADTYYHPFDLPAGFFETNIGQWWAEQSTAGSFAHAVSAQPALCEQFQAPKQHQTPPFAAVANYGYHLDAHEFAALLKRHCTEQLGVQHYSAHIDEVISDSHNQISALQTRTGQRISGDLFVDCSGFSARLIGQHYGQALTDVSHVLPNNTALAVQAGYQDPAGPVASVTYSTAHASGWLWDIGLSHRKGVGCVYSSAFCDDETATQTLLSYLAQDDTTVTPSPEAIRKIGFTPGYRATSWVENCVAVGTSMGFAEPLEASALVMVELAASHLARHLPVSKDLLSASARQYNQAFTAKWQRIVDFLKLHYVLSCRQDSPYWRTVSNISSASEQLQDWLVQWQHRAPEHTDFFYQDEVFPQASYLYVLYGMGFVTAPGHRPQASIDPLMHQLAQRRQQWQQGLPTHRALLNAI